MLVIGAKGLAKEVLEILHQNDDLKDLYFYDDISSDVPEKLYGAFPVLTDYESARTLFSRDNRFVLGVGNPAIRFDLYKKFVDAGGKMVSVISRFAKIGHYHTVVESGTIIMAGTVMTNDVKIGLGCLINPNCTISHDSTIGNFVEISPGAQITGHCVVGDFCSIGTGAILLPGTKLGNNVTVGAGAVVTKDIADFLTVVGVPAAPIK